jgi:hypothetical protein
MNQTEAAHTSTEPADAKKARQPYQVAWETKDAQQKATINTERYDYGIRRGHGDYIALAKVLEGMYLGGDYDSDGNLLPGGHWSKADLDKLRDEMRPAYEVNQVKPAVEAALGYQISNRMDISFQPSKGEATMEAATVRSKIAMQVSRNNFLHWVESDVFADGIIQRRGYLDIRMDFQDHLLGELRITSEDPLDVIPDPDASSYDPSKWGDVIVIRFLTPDDIADQWGDEAGVIAEDSTSQGYSSASDIEHLQEKRNTFGDSDTYRSTTGDISEAKQRTVPVIARQHWIRARTPVAVYPSGDIRPLSGDETPERIEQLKQEGVVVQTRIMRRVRWTVSVYQGRLLHDAWSPYDRLTIVPYFPFFRRGKSRGMVDNAIGPSKILDKAVSQIVHILNTTANSGWQFEENQLVNHTPGSLSRESGKTGLILERKVGTPPLEKITPNSMPDGMDRLVSICHKFIQDVTIPDAMRGVLNGNESGIAVQSRQHAAQQILAVPLDNLARTRYLVAKWIDYALTKYYNTARIFRITNMNPHTGKPEEEQIVINQFDQGTGTYLNDMTTGEYEVVITEQPMQITFENSQYEQAIEMRKEGINIPDVFVVKHSNLADKGELMEAIANQAETRNPVDEAKAEDLRASAELKRAQVGKVENEMANIGVDAMFSASQAAGVLVANPMHSPLADQMMRSAGFKDKDPAPIIPGLPPGNNPLEAGVANAPMPPAGQPPQPPAMAPAVNTLAAPDSSGPDGAHAGINTPAIEPV